MDIAGNERNWDAIRAEYVAGGVGLRALAERYGVSFYALRKRAAAESWTALRAGREALAGDGDAPAGDGDAPAGDGDAPAGDGDAPVGDGDAPAGDGDAPAKEAGTGSDAEIALRTRTKLLLELERMAGDLPDGAVTECKTQDGGDVRLFKLRDLTAAYRELTDDLALGSDARDEVRLIIDL